MKTSNRAEYRILVCLRFLMFSSTELSSVRRFMRTRASKSCPREQKRAAEQPFLYCSVGAITSHDSTTTCCASPGSKCCGGCSWFVLRVPLLRRVKSGSCFAIFQLIHSVPVSQDLIRGT